MVQNSNTKAQKEDFITIQDLFSLCLARWQWFVLSLVICIGVAVTYLLVTPPIYTRTASILIKEDGKGNSISSSAADDLGSLGLFQSKTNVVNEISQLESPDIMETVVRRLGLDVCYYHAGRFHRNLAYGTDLPIKIQFADSGTEAVGSFKVDIGEDGIFSLSDFHDDLIGTDSGEEIRTNSGEKVRTPLGTLTVYATKHYKRGNADEIFVTKSSVQDAITDNARKLTVALKEEKGTVIDLTFNDVSIQRAEDVLNTLIQVYNENWVKDKNQIAVSTSDFINDRLVVIEDELGTVDHSISSYKSANLIPDVQATSSLYLTESSQNNSQMLALNNQLSMARYIRNYLTGSSSKNQLLPANSGIDNANIEQQIAQYNNTLLERNNIVSSSSEKNPLVVNLDATLKSMASSILTSIDNYIATLNISLQNVRQNEARNTARIASSPTKAQHLLSVERHQKVKESLYLYLLQKR